MATPRPSTLPAAGALTTPAPRTLAGLVVALVAGASVASALIHFAVVPEHWGDYRLAALFFIGLGAFQLVWAALLVARPSRVLYLAGAGVTLATIGFWAISRTTGLPFGPFAGVAERVGRPDVISTILEELIVLGIVVLAYGNLGRHRLERPAYRGGMAAIVGAVSAGTLWGLAAVRMAGHGVPSGLAHLSGTLSLRQPSEGLLASAGHHGLHLVFAGGAVVIYGMYLVAHIRRHGMPTFSWKLSPEPGKATRA